VYKSKHFSSTLLGLPCKPSGTSREYVHPRMVEGSVLGRLIKSLRLSRVNEQALITVNPGLYLRSYLERGEEIMIPQDPSMCEITQWWDEFCRRAGTRQELLETAIGKEVRRRIFEVYASDEVVGLFDKLDMVLEFYFSLAKKVRSTEMWRLMLFWSLQSVILLADYTELESELEELGGISTGDPPEPVSTYH
jgi:hypothetical protein